MIANETQVAWLICLGYPFHPSGKLEKLRIEHLKGSLTLDVYWSRHFWRIRTTLSASS